MTFEHEWHDDIGACFGSCENEIWESDESSL
jgi:nuclear transport factor 2 (NTF2) superfamily protein